MFSPDTPAHDGASPYKVRLQKVKYPRRYRPDKYSMTFWPFAVTLTLNTIKHSFHKTLRLKNHVKHHHIMSGYKRVSGSEDIFRTKPTDGSRVGRPAGQEERQTRWFGHTFIRRLGVGGGGLMCLSSGSCHHFKREQLDKTAACISFVTV